MKKSLLAEMERPPVWGDAELEPPSTHLQPNTSSVETRTDNVLEIAKWMAKHMPPISLAGCDHTRIHLG